MNLKKVINGSLELFGYKIVRASGVSIDSVSAAEIPNDAPFKGQPATGSRKSYSLRAANNEPPRRCNLLAAQGNEQPDLAAQKISEFRRNGVVVLSTDADRALHWRETEKFDRNVGNMHSSWDWAGNSIRPYSSVLRTGLPSEDLKTELRQLITSPYYDTFFKGVLGCPVSIGNCRLVKSLPHATTGVGPQAWHEDGCPPGVIRGVLYLTDVDADAGPFQYKDDNSEVHTVIGKTGDLLIFDAMRLPHRAMPPKSGVRMAVDLAFMPRPPGSEAMVIAAGMNHWPADPFAFSLPRDRSQQRFDQLSS